MRRIACEMQPAHAGAEPEPRAPGTTGAADELSDTLDDGPPTEDDIDAVRAFLENPVGVTYDGERAHAARGGARGAC